MSGPIIGGLDLSLTSTGIAVIGVGKPAAFAYKPKTRGYQRLDDITATVLRELKGCDVVAVEGLAAHVQGSAIFDLAGLWWHVTLELQREVPLAVVPVATLKKFGTGKGNADKFAMVTEAVRRFPEAGIRGDDAADALWLAATAAEHYGHPVVKLPQVQREALDAVAKTGRRKGKPVIEWPLLCRVAEETEPTLFG